MSPSISLKVYILGKVPSYTLSYASWISCLSWSVSKNTYKVFTVYVPNRGMLCNVHIVLYTSGKEKKMLSDLVEKTMEKWD